jgi:hypothetical protein
MTRRPADMVTPYREVVHDFDDDGYLDTPHVNPLEIGIITTLPIPTQDKARIRRERARKQPFGFRQL